MKRLFDVRIATGFLAVGLVLSSSPIWAGNWIPLFGTRLPSTSGSGRTIIVGARLRSRQMTVM